MARCIYFDMPWTGRIPTCGAGYLTCPNDRSCEGYRVAKPPTNADRIRGMSDEELAEMLTGDREWLCKIMCGKVTICSGNCKEKALDWLRQPAETEGTE